jgi:hypothetical protein
MAPPRARSSRWPSCRSGGRRSEQTTPVTYVWFSPDRHKPIHKRSARIDLAPDTEECSTALITARVRKMPKVAPGSLYALCRTQLPAKICIGFSYPCARAHVISVCLGADAAGHDHLVIVICAWGRRPHACVHFCWVWLVAAIG